MDAITMLRQQHREVEKLFKAVDKGDLSVVPEICAALTEHARIEEDVFYPAVRAEAPDELSIILESYEEHLIVKRLISELESMSSGDETYQAKATVLSENVRHHVKEEEDELFPAVRSALGRKRLTELAEEMQQDKAAA
ncbi:MAG TPA: hemerythrin domain-containing protein [Candidatus Nanopelagicales bacterium]|nr:hemerythrin domain-containing protein [Candidatus Nanopelagicales bacterium]